jgi:hypothetical protein
MHAAEMFTHKAVELSGGSMLMLGWLGLALGQAGRTAEARGVLEKLQAAPDRQVQRLSAAAR